MADKTDPKEMGFGAAMTELEGILRRVEGEETDIDELAVELQRAARLLEACREKIRRAEVEVNQIVESLDEAQAGDTDAGSSADDDGETASLFPDEG